MSVIECVSLSDMTVCEPPKESVLALGNFDGVHMAHRRLLKQVRELRRERFPSAVCAVFCFQKPSTDFLSAEPPLHLCTTEEKLSYFREEGMEYVFLADFPQIMFLSLQEFAESILQDRCHVAAAVCGFNYHFGKGGMGDAASLSTLLSAPVSVQEPILADGETVSSTRIRRLIREGSIQDANRLLTRPYSVSAEIVRGKSLGRKLGFPTINQSFPDGILIPRLGVYVSECEVDGISYRSITNVGVHPTVDQDFPVNCETYLFDFSGNLYGKRIRVSFLSYLRPEQKFPDIHTLQAQIQTDIASAKAFRK